MFHSVFASRCYHICSMLFLLHSSFSFFSPSSTAGGANLVMRYQWLRDLYESADKDSSGQLSVKEVLTLMKELNVGICKKILTQKFKVSLSFFPFFFFFFGLLSSFSFLFPSLLLLFLLSSFTILSYLLSFFLLFFPFALVVMVASQNRARPSL